MNFLRISDSGVCNLTVQFKPVQLGCMKTTLQCNKVSLKFLDDDDGYESDDTDLIDVIHYLLNM